MVGHEKEEVNICVVTFYHKDMKTLNTLEQKLVEGFKKSLVDKYSKKEEGIKCYQYDPKEKQWDTIKVNISKNFTNTVLNEKTCSLIKHSVKTFDSTEKKYDEFGQPYKLGFLFYGPPGTGKTSSVYAISNEFEKDIYYANEGLINDDFPITVLNDIKPGSLFVFEDIDLMLKSFIEKRNNLESSPKTDDKNTKKKDNKDNEKKKEPKAEDFFSTIIKINRNKLLRKFLNVLDGYFCLRGVIIVFTTNAIDGFDPALLRPGRIDHKILFDYCDINQIKRIYELYGKLDEFNLNKYKDKNVTSADVTNEMFQLINGNLSK